MRDAPRLDPAAPTGRRPAATRALVRRLQALLLVAALACSAQAAAIDPVMLLLMRMLRDKVILALADAAVERALKAPEPGLPAAPPAPPAGLPPPGLAEPERLRYIIDHNFTYLSAAEREEVHRGLMQALDDPAHQATRNRMIEEFSRTALAVGHAQRVLDTLSRSEKQEIASAAASAYHQLPPAERQEMLAMLHSRQAPIPADLNAMMLEAIASR
jgi:hypothetical protein